MKTHRNYDQVFVVNEGVTEIPDREFWGSNMEVLYLPLSLTAIHAEVFQYCNKLIDVYYKGTIADWCKVELYGYMANPSAYGANFYCLDENGQYTLVRNIVIPGSCAHIGPYQFYNWKNLEEIIFEEGVCLLGAGVCTGCVELKKVTLATTIKRIPFNAFKGCKKLNTLVLELPMQIGDGAFGYCPPIKMISSKEKES